MDEQEGDNMQEKLQEQTLAASATGGTPAFLQCAFFAGALVLKFKKINRSSEPTGPGKSS